jgi:hypothetical protein
MTGKKIKIKSTSITQNFTSNFGPFKGIVDSKGCMRSAFFSHIFFCFLFFFVFFLSNTQESCASLLIEEEYEHKYKNKSWPTSSTQSRLLAQNDVSWLFKTWKNLHCKANFHTQQQKSYTWIHDVFRSVALKLPNSINYVFECLSSANLFLTKPR